MNEIAVIESNTNNKNEIVLHEDKEYYASAQSVYGDDVEIQIEEEDTQPLEVPIIAPLKERCFELIEESLPSTTFNWSFLTSLMDSTSLIRNIGFLGHLHHGKTSFLSMLVKETHHFKKNEESMVKYNDHRRDEQDRGLSIKASPISLILADIRSKHWLLNCLDVPGHVNFADEMSASLRLMDGAVIVVDVAEGVLLNTKRAILDALEQGLVICLVLNKMDRLIIELKLPPKDAYYKILHVLSEVNEVINNDELSLHPIKGNVCFASSWFSWSFTLESFAKIYSDYHQKFNYKQLANKLWGDIYYNSNDGIFVKKGKKRSFVEFILEPLYKIYAHSLGSDPSKLFPMFHELGIRLKKKELMLDPKPLLSLILKKFFGGSEGFVSMIIQNIPSPKQANKMKIIQNYCGNLQSRLAQNMIHCISHCKTAMVNITKMYSRPNASKFDAFGRVFCGTIKVGDQVKVLREGYSPENTEDMTVMTIKNIWIYQARYRVQINQIKAGNWALFGGIDSAITKTATITSINAPKQVHIFRPLKFNTISVCKVK